MRGLILSDGKPGHVNQSRAFCTLMRLEAHEATVEFVSDMRERLLRARMNFATRHPKNIPELLGLLGNYLTPPSLKSLQQVLPFQPDFVVSAGSSVAAANLLIAKTLHARPVAIMRPTALPLDQFSLLVLPEHDRKQKVSENVIYTPVTLSFFDAGRIRAADQEIESRFGKDTLGKRPLALIVGGSSSHFVLDKDEVVSLAETCWAWAARTGHGMMASTSRRTPSEIENALVTAFSKSMAKDAYWVWGRTDPFNPLPALLPRACAAVVTEDSVSMISEAILQGHRPLVVKMKKHRQSPKLARFRNYLIEKGFARWVDASEVKDILDEEPETLETSPPVDLGALRQAICARLGISG